MPKARTVYVCQQCGYQSSRWLGRCPECNAWDSLVESIPEGEGQPRRGASQVSLVGAAQPQSIAQISIDGYERALVPIGEFNRVLGGGIVPGSMVLVSGDPGIGKCLTGDTRVLDPATGAYRPITDWMAERRQVVAVDEQTLNLAPAAVSAFYERGVHPIVEVRTKLGRTLRCTPDHPLLTPEGWRPAQELSAGSYLAGPRALPYFGQERMFEEEVKLIARTLADEPTQAIARVTPWFSAAGQGIQEPTDQLRLDSGSNDFSRYPLSTEATKAVTINFSRHPQCRALATAFHQEGKVNISCAEGTKCVPDSIFGLPRDQMALFLRVLFACSGSVYVHVDGAPGLSYSTASLRLAKDVQHLLLRFGLLSALQTYKRRVDGASYTAYELVPLQFTSLQRFLAEIGTTSRQITRRQVATLETPLLPTHDAERGVPKLCFGMAGPEQSSGTPRNVLCSRMSEEMAPTADVYWDEVVSITPAGEAPVYDISVPGKANFCANDLIVHNSTLLLQVAGLVAQRGDTVLYVSAEESPQQVTLRARRLGLIPDSLYILSETNLDRILQQIEKLSPALAIVDSIQTVYLEALSSAAGSVSQVREGAAVLTRLAKEKQIPIFLVGHVTKAGAIAGPRVLEHIVDTVLYLEGDRFHQYRLLRSVKNRFGSTFEVGVFEMANEGMQEVDNPSMAFLAERSPSTPGSSVVVTMEGTRPLLVEVQALTATSSLALPRRTANGIDTGRLLLLAAVLSKRVGLTLGNQDIYVNVVGGMNIHEPAADLGVAVSIASVFRNVPADPDMVMIGEVGLSGELRSVGQLERRLTEAAKLGFKRSVYPRTSRKPQAPEGFEVIGVRSVVEALDVALKR